MAASLATGMSLPRSTPVANPIRSNIQTTSSVATLPVAPGANGQPPSPPKEDRTRALLPGAPRARLPSQARRCHGRGMPKPSPREKRVMQISKRLSTCVGSARPVVSQRQISASGRIGIRRSRSAIVLASGTRPSKGQSKAVAMFNRMNRPVGMAASRRAYSSADSSGYRVRGGRTNDNRDEV
jgi:hypothetical protein